MGKRKGIGGVSAASIAVMATIAGAPPAAADIVIICDPTCPEIEKPGNHGEAAFDKIAFLKYPGATEGVFWKQDGMPPAFIKIGELGFPGGTEDVFQKIK